MTRRFWGLVAALGLGVALAASAGFTFDLLTRGWWCR